MQSNSKNERSPLGFNEVELDDITAESGSKSKVKGMQKQGTALEFERENGRGAPLNNQTLLTED